MTIYIYTYMYTNTHTDISPSIMKVQMLSPDSHFNRFIHFKKNT